MYSHTQKVGSLGRYGPRIGRKIRNEIKKIEDQQKESKCTNCGKKAKRVTAGIWECKSCKTQFTGGAYLPATRRK